MTELSGKVQTVLGPADPVDLGITLPHEHLFVDLSTLLMRSGVEPVAATEKVLFHAKLCVENRWWVAYKPMASLDNNILLDEELAIREAAHFHRAGGGSLVDLSSELIGRDPKALVRVSRATGLHIIMGSGYYVNATHPSDMDRKTEEDIAEEIVRDITAGVGDTGVHAGVIGELGCEYPLHPNEAKVLRAAVKAQKRTGAAINVHPGRHPRAPIEVVELLVKEGADPKRVAISHLDRTLRDMKDLLALAHTGCYLGYDLFGQEGYYLVPTFDLPNDHQRINDLIHLIEHGHFEHLPISQDVCQKHVLRTYGGAGYDHILTHAVPVMRLKGMTEEQIRQIMVGNPARFLTLS